MANNFQNPYLPYPPKMINMLSEQRKPRFEKKGGQKNVESAL